MQGKLTIQNFARQARFSGTSTPQACSQNAIVPLVLRKCASCEAYMNTAFFASSSTLLLEIQRYSRRPVVLLSCLNCEKGGHKDFCWSSRLR